MQFSLILLAAFAVCGGVGCFESFRGMARNESFPNACYHKETQTPVKVGKLYRPIGLCQKIECLNTEQFVLRSLHCPRYMIGEGCDVIAGDLTVPFPECCPKIRCTDRNGDVTINNTY